jgi:hypothetical protein
MSTVPGNGLPNASSVTVVWFDNSEQTFNCSYVVYKDQMLLLSNELGGAPIVVPLHNVKYVKVVR